jgi:hypothetical protein
MKLRDLVANHSGREAFTWKSLNAVGDTVKTLGPGCEKYIQLFDWGR